MSYGHSAAVLAAMGSCAATDEACPRPAVVTDDTDPAVRWCARHATTRLRYAVEAPVQCGRTRPHGPHHTTEGHCPGLDGAQVRLSLHTLRHSLLEGR